MKNPVVEALEKAVRGLLYVSETEATIEPFLWEGRDLSDEQLLECAGAEKGTPVEQATLDSFFRTVSKADKPRFEGLAKILKEQLAGAKVFKIGGEADKVVIVVGKTSDGNWAGIKTTVVET